MKGGNECNTPSVKENKLVLWDGCSPSPGLRGAVPCLSPPQTPSTPTEPDGEHMELNNPPAGVISSCPAAEAVRAWSDALSIPGIQHKLTTRCCKRLRMGLQPVLQRCFASQRKPRVQCYVVTAKVIKCILLSRFPKAVLTQRQLFFPQYFNSFNEYAYQAHKRSS